MAAAAAVRGIGAKLGLREIRIHLCQRSPGSQGVRDFIEKRYVELKKANPDLPILIRECSDVQPKLWARYGERGTPRVWDSAFGQEKNVSLNNFSADQVTRTVENVLSGKA
ncbi:NADH dehydrogenase [ubiquinone] 1 alpha subcomplex subunit 2 isoform X1 [Microcebus murinus]|uniref:NADH dehydrogenase [ubiquinone] 1 alpha subcomplex subunit 2 isoform X1 n=1 Tax=Microcebus murinus TaxID=30608 RepID=UPI0006431E43|nr:NADH dehydrogenase [ubiquinone] 1 alpha subcomplex subunit 2 isoform X1 [Microcebus murinus]